MTDINSSTTRRLFDGDTFEHNGRTFRFKLERDDSMGPPWKEHDGHGSVREVRADYKEQKRPGERLLISDRWHAYLYDWQGAIATAKTDGWGLGDDEIERVTKALGRPMTRGMIVEEAVKRDFEFIRRWLNDEWHWCGVIVEHPETGLSESLWGIESEAEDYLVEVAYQLADQINAQLDTEMADDIAASRPDLSPEFHP